VGQKKRTDPTAEERQAERVTSALEETDRTGRAPDIIKDNPGQFLRDMYEVWHRQGGKEGGRPRNSIRKMREQWLTGRNHVPSLHPKLMGRVKLTRSDVRALVGLFLERWRFSESSYALDQTIRDGYSTFAADDLARLSKKIVDGLSKTDGRKSSVSLPIQTDNKEKIEQAKLRWVNVENVLHECDALMTLSRHKIAVGANPVWTIKTFWNMIDQLYEYDRINQIPDRLLIWAIDFGSRKIGEKDSFDEYFNAGLLALQLYSVASFNSEKDENVAKLSRRLPVLRVTDALDRAKRWDWLVERTAIVVQNLDLEAYNALHPGEDQQLSSIRLMDIGVTGEHVLPSTTPSRWAEELRKLYRRNVEAADATLTVFVRNDPWMIAGQSKLIRYFAHSDLRSSSHLKKSAEDELEPVTESRELPSPGSNYDDAFRLVYWASRYRLGKVDESTSTIGIDALAYLRKVGFRVLSMPGFLSTFGGGHQTNDVRLSLK